MYTYTIRYYEPLLIHGTLSEVRPIRVVTIERDFEHAPEVVFHMIQESGLEVAENHIIFPAQMIDLKWVKK